MATMKVKIQLARPARDMALGRGPCRNSSAPIMGGMGPAKMQNFETFYKKRRKVTPVQHLLGVAVIDVEFFSG